LPQKRPVGAFLPRTLPSSIPIRRTRGRGTRLAGRQNHSPRFKSSGSRAILTATRRASSSVSGARTIGVTLPSRPYGSADSASWGRFPESLDRALSGRLSRHAAAARGAWSPNAAISGVASSAGGGRAERRKAIDPPRPSAPAGFLGAPVRASLSLPPTGEASAPCC
jgi:hypothetical protein